METEKLVDLLEEIDKSTLAMVRDVFEDAASRGEELSPAGMVFAMKTPGGTVLEKPDLIMMPLCHYFTSGAGKDEAMAILKRIATDLDGIAIYVVAESWMVQAKLAKNMPLEEAKKIATKLYEELPPSQHPDRIETVNISVSTKLGCHSYMGKITGEGTDRKLGEWDRMEGGGGRMANLFDVPSAGGASA